MIIYQVKITVQPAIHEEWLHWMKTVHVPDLVATGLISSFQIWRVEDSEDLTYSFNYYFAGQADLEKYQNEFAPTLKADVIERYPNQFVATRQVYSQL